MKRYRSVGPFGGKGACACVVIAGVLALAGLAAAEVPTRDPSGSWPMPGANPQRTSWCSEEVPGQLAPAWYRPIEPYISQNVQVVATDGLLYVATARGLYAFRAEDGEPAWVYPTELPLGQSPAIDHGVAYVGGFDRKLHAIDAKTGKGLWTFDAAQAGYRSSPLVVEGLVYAGNRDGTMYAVGAQGTAQAGKLVWKRQVGGPIMASAAYADGRLYFGANDCYAYALDARTGEVVWKSGKLPTAGFQSWWPVVWKDKVVFSGSIPNYRNECRPGAQSVAPNNRGDIHNQMERQEVYGGQTRGIIGEKGTGKGPWAEGTTTIDMTKAMDYLQEKPWRRTVFILDGRTGKEYTFEYKGKPAYAPILYMGTKNGYRTPPMVGPDGALYVLNNFVAGEWICRGHATGWAPGLTYVSQPSGNKTNAVDEPMALSGGGKLIYWSLCCDREMGTCSLIPGGGGWQFVMYNLVRLCPGYDAMWASVGDQDGTGNRLWGAYGSNNGIYHNASGDQNALIPYAGKLFVHRSNCLIAFDAKGGKKKLELAKVVPAAAEDGAFPAHSDQWLKDRLAAEVGRMIQAGHLRTGYFNGAQWWQWQQWGDNLNDYFHHPGDTLWTLARALPHLPPELQQQAKTYLQSEFAAYPPDKIAHIGWKDGAAREAFDLPPEVQADLGKYGPSTRSNTRFWTFPPDAAYAMWKYAQVFGDAPQLLQGAQRCISGRMPSDALLTEFPYVANAYIAGYVGYLNLSKLAGQAEPPEVKAELNRLLELRASTFSKDTPWTSTKEASHIKQISVFRNFLYLTPELADYLREHALPKVQACLDEIEHVAPYWYVTHYEGCLQEGSIQHLNDYGCVFQAHAWILKEGRAKLDRHLDVPAFAVGDLFYIQQLCSLLEAP